MKNKKIQSLFLGSTFLVYLMLFGYILLFKYVAPWELFSNERVFYRSLNLIPFATILSYWNQGGANSVDVNLWGNIILFIPLGIYLPLFSGNKKIFKTIGWIGLISLAVELAQYVLAIGAGDIDDIILNILGGMIGILLYRLLFFFLKSRAKVKCWIAFFSAIVGLPGMALCVFLFLTNWSS